MYQLRYTIDGILTTSVFEADGDIEAVDKALTWLHDNFMWQKKVDTVYVTDFFPASLGEQNYSMILYCFDNTVCIDIREPA